MLNDYKVFTTKPLLYDQNHATANPFITFYKHQAGNPFIYLLFKIMFATQ